MKKALKYRSGRLTALALAIITVVALTMSLTACMGMGNRDDRPDNGASDQNGDRGDLPNNGDVTPENPDMNGSTGDTSNTLGGKTAEGIVYHTLGSSTQNSEGSTDFMLVTEEGKHYYVRGSSSNGADLRSGSKAEGNTSPNGTDTGNMNGSGTNGQSGTDTATPPTDNTGSAENAQGGNVSVSLGDKVRVEITKGTDNGSVAVIEEGKVTVVEKFDATLLNAKIYTKKGIPAEVLSGTGSTAAGWYHQKFDDFSDYGVFLDKYDLRNHIESIYNAFSDGAVPSIDEDFFKNNSIHIFAVPYNSEVDSDDEGSLYKSGSSLYLMVKENGHADYLRGLSGVMGDVGNAIRNGANAIGNAAGDLVEGAGNAARDILNGAGNAVGDIANGTGNAAKDITDGTGDAARDATRGAGNATRDITDGNNTDNGNGSANSNGMTEDNGPADSNGMSGNHSADNGENTSDNGTFCRFYIVLLGEEGKGLDNGVVLISE